jgi:hypothetical protein
MAMLRFLRFSGSLKKAFKVSEARFLAAAVPFAFCVSYLKHTLESNLHVILCLKLIVQLYSLSQDYETILTTLMHLSN